MKKLDLPLVGLDHLSLLKILPFGVAYLPHDELPDEANPESVTIAMMFSYANLTAQPHKQFDPAPIN